MFQRLTFAKFQELQHKILEEEKQGLREPAFDAFTLGKKEGFKTVLKLLKDMDDSTMSDKTKLDCLKARLQEYIDD